MTGLLLRNLHNFVAIHCHGHANLLELVQWAKFRDGTCSFTFASTFATRPVVLSGFLVQNWVLWYRLNLLSFPHPFLSLLDPPFPFLSLLPFHSPPLLPSILLPFLFPSLPPLLPLPSLSSPSLSPSVSATAFYKHQPVLEFLCEVLELGNIEDQRRPLSDSQRVKFAKEVKGMCVGMRRM